MLHFGIEFKYIIPPWINIYNYLPRIIKDINEIPERTKYNSVPIGKGFIIADSPIKSVGRNYSNEKVIHWCKSKKFELFYLNWQGGNKSRCIQGQGKPITLEEILKSLEKRYLMPINHQPKKKEGKNDKKNY